MVERITFGGYQGDNSVHTRGARSFAAAVSRLSAGKVEVTFRQNIVQDGHKASDLLSVTAHLLRAAFAAATRAQVNATRARFTPSLIAMFEDDIAKVNEART